MKYNSQFRLTIDMIVFENINISRKQNMFKYVLQTLINKINQTNLNKNVSTNVHCRTMRFLNIFVEDVKHTDLYLKCCPVNVNNYYDLISILFIYRTNTIAH